METVMRLWQGHQTSPTVVSLKGRLPQKLQSKSTLSFEIVQIHSLFRHGFIKKPKSKFNRNRNTILFSIFSSLIFCSITYLFEKRKGGYSCLPSSDSLNYSLSFFKGWFHLCSFYSVQNASCSFTCI